MQFLKKTVRLKQLQVNVIKFKKCETIAHNQPTLNKLLINDLMFVNEVEKHLKINT